MIRRPRLNSIRRAHLRGAMLVAAATALVAFPAPGASATAVPTAAGRITADRGPRAVTGELYTNYVVPATAANAAALNQNNHRTKSGAAVAIAAVALGGDVPAAEGRAWWDWGSAEVDDILPGPQTGPQAGLQQRRA